jgi:outer membrane lipoprotein-sorting protein
MRAKAFFLVFIILSFFSSLCGQTAEELIAQADQLYAEMKDMAAAQEAMKKYQDALLAAENKYEAY